MTSEEEEPDDYEFVELDPVPEVCILIQCSPCTDFNNFFFFSFFF